MHFVVFAQNVQMQHHIAKWRISLEGLPNSTNPELFVEPKTKNLTNKNIRLIDWREWQLMGGNNQQALGGEDSSSPMLIVGLPEDNSNLEPISLPPPPLNNSPPEAEFGDDERNSNTENVTHIEKSEKILTTTQPVTTTTKILETTKEALATTITSTEKDITTTDSSLAATSSIPALDLKNLPTLFNLINQLAVIPNLVRSFSGSSGSTPAAATAAGVPILNSGPIATSAIGTEAGNLLQMFTGDALNSERSNGYNMDLTDKPAFHSKALSPNSGYSALSPSWIPEETPEKTPTENKLFSLKSAKLTSTPEFNSDSTSNLNYKNKANGIRPIVPVLTTYDSGKIRHIPISESSTPSTTNPKLKLNAQARFNRLNIYKIEAELNGSNANAYEAPLHEKFNQSNSRIAKRKQRPRFDLSELTVNEVEQLESIHRKLFKTTIENSTRKLPQTSIYPKSSPRKSGMFSRNLGRNTAKDNQFEEGFAETTTVSQFETTTTPPLLIYQKPSEGKAPHHSSVNSLMQQHFGSANSLQNLDPGILNELSTIKDLPDLDELTKYMDLSLLNKPGGFATLKQQFMERLIQRTLGRRKLLKDSSFLNRRRNSGRRSEEKANNNNNSYVT